jgi:hypothetical protein
VVVRVLHPVRQRLEDRKKQSEILERLVLVEIPPV